MSTPGSPMLVRFVKLSDRRHRVEVRRGDGSSESVELDTRSFLRHDLAHYAVESTFAITGGVWGTIAAGGSFEGTGLDGPDVALAERLAGPVQTLMRARADAVEVLELLTRVAPELADESTAAELHERMRALTGHWSAIGYGDALELEWPLTPRTSDAG